MEKFYLGISLGFNSSACVYSDERGLISAISQERLNGQKNTKELPLDAAVKCCEIAGVEIIHKIAISHYENISDSYFTRYGEKYNLEGETWEDMLLNYFNHNTGITIEDEDIERIAHHVAHRLSTVAFYESPKDGDYFITSDGFGDGYSGMIYRVNGSDMSLIDLKNSIALVYQFVTGALGYKEHQHEGKITGLAAYGEPKYLDDFHALYGDGDSDNGLNFKSDAVLLNNDEIEQVTTSNIIDFDKFLKLKKAVYGVVNNLLKNGAKPEDIAATVQEFAEMHTLKWITSIVTSNGHNCYLAGGLFANVKINQRIKDLGIFKNVYVCPAMGDEGTAVGAAVAAAGTCNAIKSPNQCGTCVPGNRRTFERIKDEIDRTKYEVKYIEDNVADYVAENLARNKIVCLMRDAMEFGPRALCHRSILYNCDTKETNDWLNKKLSRTEFMPFAPVCREEVADDLFKNLDGGRDSAKHMTMTFDCTDEFIQNYPAACHIDNTARPQIVSSHEDPFIWNVLERYQNITGKKALINTSFNLHNYPIIESEEVGLDSWLKSDTDILVIGNVVIEKIGGRDE